MRRCRARSSRVAFAAAVDTGFPPKVEIVSAFNAAAISGDALGKPDLLKPNAEELAELAAAAGFATNKSAEELEADPAAAAAAKVMSDLDRRVAAEARSAG